MWSQASLNLQTARQAGCWPLFLTVPSPLSPPQKRGEAHHVPISKLAYSIIEGAGYMWMILALPPQTDTTL